MPEQTLTNLATRLQQFSTERDWDQFHTPKNLAMALSVEVAELVEIFQWLTVEQSAALTAEQRRQASEEIGDVLIYLTRLADRLGIDPLAVAFAKLEKNADRYPLDKARGSAKKYTELG